MTGVGPRASVNPILPWVLLAAIWGGAGVAGLVWVTVRLAAAVGGGQVAPFTAFVGHLVDGRTDLAASGVPAGWIAGFGVLAAAVATVTATAAGMSWSRWRGRHRRSQPWRLALPSMASPADVAALTPTGVTARVSSLRPSLAGVDLRRLPADEAGWTVGDLMPRGPLLRGSWEDVAVAFMAPRSGKTTALAIPMTLAAPGAVVATANKSDLWAATAALSAAQDRTVWAFDPQQIAHIEQTWWWNPLGAIRGVEDADRLASHFIQEIRGTGQGGDFWQAAAGDLLASLFLAAAVSDRTLTDVYGWLNDSSSPLPADELSAHGYPAVAGGLRGRQSGAPETREGVFETARAAARCLRNDRILRWVTPGHADVQFDAATFVTRRDVLHLLSKTDEGAAAPLVAALTDQVVRAGVSRAEGRGGRLDPPMLLVLDEAANICKIDDLPDLYSHLGSRGIVPLTILQSYQQGVRVWTPAGMDALWSAATIKIIGAGIDDPKMAEDLSRLVGDHDVTTTSVSRSSQGTSMSISPRRQRILEAADIRALPKGRALLMATGARIAAVSLRPWYTGPHRGEITAANAAATRQISARATGATPSAPSGKDLDDDAAVTPAG